MSMMDGDTLFVIVLIDVFTDHSKPYISLSLRSTTEQHKTLSSCCFVSGLNDKVNVLCSAMDGRQSGVVVLECPSLSGVR